MEPSSGVEKVANMNDTKDKETMHMVACPRCSKKGVLRPLECRKVDTLDDIMCSVHGNIPYDEVMRRPVNPND